MRNAGSYEASGAWHDDAAAGEARQSKIPWRLAAYGYQYFADAENSLNMELAAAELATEKLLENVEKAGLYTRL